MGILTAANERTSVNIVKPTDERWLQFGRHLEGFRCRRWRIQPLFFHTEGLIGLGFHRFGYVVLHTEGLIGLGFHRLGYVVLYTEELI